VASHSAREVDRIKAEEADGEHPVQTAAPKKKTYEWVDKKTGEVHQVPVGIDPGWAYNPGKSGWEPQK